MTAHVLCDSFLYLWVCSMHEIGITFLFINFIYWFYWRIYVQFKWFLYPLIIHVQGMLPFLLRVLLVLIPVIRCIYIMRATLAHGLTDLPNNNEKGPPNYIKNFGASKKYMVRSVSMLGKCLPRLEVSLIRFVLLTSSKEFFTSLGLFWVVPTPSLVTYSFKR